MCSELCTCTFESEQSSDSIQKDYRQSEPRKERQRGQGLTNEHRESQEKEDVNKEIDTCLCTTLPLRYYCRITLLLIGCTERKSFSRPIE